MRTGSHLNAKFKGRHEEEYAWFAAGNATPGLRPERRVGRAEDSRCVRGRRRGIGAGLAGEVGGVFLRTMMPNLTAGLSALVNDLILPEPGGIGKRSLGRA